MTQANSGQKNGILKRKKTLSEEENPPNPLFKGQTIFELCEGITLTFQYASVVIFSLYRKGFFENILIHFNKNK